MDSCTQCRTLFSLIWSCLATIFLCNWVSVHLNVPPPGLGFFARMRRKLRMMFVTLIAPELMLGLAARQYVVAQWFARSQQSYTVSLTHGFFFVMGGFVSRDSRHPIAANAQLGAYLKGLRDIKKEDIIDKSKGDSLIACVTLVQVLWFAAQELARLQQGLPISTLEIATASFVIINMVTWALWRQKPKDVSEAIPIDPVSCSRAIDIKPLRRQLTIGDHLDGIVLGHYRNFDPLESASVPAFWSNPFGEKPEGLPIVLFWQLICAIFFGVVHCFAWNTRFPSTIEMWMWRVSASFISGFPLLCFLLLQINKGLGDRSVPKKVFTYINYGLVALYVIARVALLILPITTLRALPIRVFVDVGWSSVFPHI
ncbi:hypothetical protein K438DRAFT_1558559 [Mycena galopus ATCC 62051]|nr:hypothetical protein K438DRAFT_1558559 [Mycena galopus ATCC 62051]